MRSIHTLFFIQLIAVTLVSCTQFRIYGLDYTARRINYCPSQAQVNQDMQIVASLAQHVRIYSLVDCNQGPMILTAIQTLNLNLRVTLGMWVDIYYYAEFPNEYSALISLNQNFGLSLVDSIIVGSETQYRGDFPVSQLIGYIQNVSVTVKQQMGYPNIQITTADVIDSLAGLPQLIAAVDYVAYNEFAFWENIAIADAVQVTINRYNNFVQHAQGKKIVISEVGWPDTGDAQGNAVPSAQNENTFFQGVVCWATQNQIPLYYFAAFDSLWQTDDDQKHWGLYDENRNLKAGISLNFPCTPPSGQSFPTTTSSSSSATSATTATQATTATRATTATSATRATGNLSSTSKATTTIAKASSTKTQASSTGSTRATATKAHASTSTGKASTTKTRASSTASFASTTKTAHSSTR